MTMQIGMIASDGIVLASDTEHTVYVCNDSLRDGYGSFKIKIGESKKIAVTCAYHMPTASKIAESLIVEFEKQGFGEQPEQRIRAIGIEIASEPGSGGAECIVATVGPPSQMYRFRYLGRGDDIVCERITDRVRAGDTANSALFWISRYYSRKLRVEQLVRLGANFIVSAGQILTTIRGLEIVTCTSSGFARLPPEEITRLEDWASSLDAQIRDLIFENS